MTLPLRAKGGVLDLFAGPGGWSEGLRMHGLAELGIELDANACATARAAGHERLQADVAALDPADFAKNGKVIGLIASPPCQAWSAAGRRKGEFDKSVCTQIAHDIAAGSDTRRALGQHCEDKRSALVVEPLRWALALRPRWIALEQVPAVLGLWSLYAHMLAAFGYETWAGCLVAANYGVPQTRERAFLLASLDGPVGPPPPTHSDQRRAGCLLGLEPWVTMADALGWGMTARPSVTIVGGGKRYGAKPLGGGTGSQRAIDRERAAGAWCWERPATTVCGDPRIPEPGWRGNPEDYADGNPTRSGDNAVRVAIEEAGVLQSFRPDYPWQGSQGEKFLQVGNAVPPLLAYAVLGQLIDPQEARRAA